MGKTLAFAASLALLAQSTGAWAADVGGRYTVAGTNFYGSIYKGTAEITVSSNSTCRIVWHIGASDWKGICMRVNDSLAAAYQYKNTIGLVHYDIKPDGVLDGIWTMADRDGAGTDVLTPQE